MKILRRSHGRFPAAIVLATLSSPIVAAELPTIKLDAGNTVPACATPAHLQAYLESQNPRLDPRFATIAAEYAQRGQALGVRWDMAFFQMMRETGALTYQNGARFNATPSQHSFAGLKPVGSDQLETFPDVGTGVQAHLEHLLFYAGDKVANPVSKRTRKQQETDVLGSWRAGLGHPVSFADLAAKWTDGSNTYAKLLEKIADTFTSQQCATVDANPAQVATADAPAKPDRGADLARQAITNAGIERSALGATAPAAAATTPQVRILNAPSDAASASPNSSEPPSTKLAAVGPVAKPMSSSPSNGLTAVPAQKCRVWTASYGGQHAVIVKSTVDAIANYTVLDVNEGQEAREAEAFISAYAKGGTIAGEFQTQDKALATAFELCPEG